MNVFAYNSGKSVLHRLDVRFKFMILFVFALSALKADGTALAILLAVQFLLLKHLRMSLRASFFDLRHLLIFLALVAVVRSVVLPGAPLLNLGFVTLSREGLLDGTALATRMLAVVFLGLLLIASTRPAEIKAAVEWFLKPLPGIPAARIGTMLGLLMRFMPLIFQQAGKTREAQRARAIENRKNPFYRLTRFTLPFMRCTFESADRLALAMEARGYRDQRTPPRLIAGRFDWAVFAVTMGFVLLLWVV